jgi:hypothetical protein
VLGGGGSGQRQRANFSGVADIGRGREKDDRRDGQKKVEGKTRNQMIATSGWKRKVVSQRGWAIVQLVAM